jgi:dipeptidyl aminopeptidase/acylaminoacyl peptidase
MVYVLRSLLLISMLASTVWAQDVIPPPADMVHEGVPPIPTSVPASTYRYLTSYSPSFIGWDPVKPEPVVTGYYAGSTHAGRVRNPGEPPDFFTPLPDGYSEIYYAPGGKYFLYLKGGADSQPQIYRYDIDSKTSTMLTDGKSRNRYPIWSNSGKRVAYSSSRRDGTDLDLYIMDPLDPKSSRMVAEVKGGDWAPFAWSPDDRRLILSDAHSWDESYLWLLDLESGRKTLLTPPDGGHAVLNGSYAYFSKDGKGIYLSTNSGSEFQRLAYQDLSTGKRRFLTEGIPWDVDEFALSPDGNFLAFVSNEDGVGRFHVMDTRAYKELPVPDMPGAGIVVPGTGVVPGLQWHPSLPYVAFMFNSTKNPPEVFSLNIASGKIERWTRAAKAVRTAELREPELVKWKSFDGRMISGYLYRPPDSFTGKLPVVIDLHGGPTDQFRPAFRGGDNYFTNVLGIAMIYPNVRGSSGYGRTFMRLDDGLRRLDATRDVGALLEWIAGRPDLDPARVMLRGGSYGGYLALSAASMYSNRVSGVISYAAPTNLATFIERSYESDQAEWRREMGDERDKKTREFLDGIAPVNNADKITRPVLLMIGGKDGMESVAESERIVSKLKDNRVPVWYLLAKNEGHGYADLGNYEYALDSEILFTRRFLLGDSSVGSPADSSAAGSSVEPPQPAPAGGAAGQPPALAQLPTVEEVLDKYVLAIGGRAAILSIKSSVSRGTVDIPATGYHADSEYWREAPDKFESELVVSDSMTTSTVFDGATGWSDSIEAGIRRMEGEELAETKRQADFYRSLHLKDLYPKMTLSHTEKIGDADTFVIDAIRADGKPAKLFFDVKTGLLLRTDYVTYSLDVQVYLSDYRDVDGVKTPFTTRFVYKTVTRIHKLKEVKNNVEIDESRFAKPKPSN